MSLTLYPPFAELQSTTFGGHVRFDKLAVKHETDLNQVRAYPQDIEAERREMRRHQPARFVAVGNDHRLDSERSPRWRAALLSKKGVCSQEMPNRPSLYKSIDEIHAFWFTLRSTRSAVASTTSERRQVCAACAPASSVVETIPPAGLSPIATGLARVV